MGYNETHEACFLKDQREVVMVLGVYPMEKSYFPLPSSLYTPPHTYIHISGVYRYEYCDLEEVSQMGQACETHFCYLCLPKKKKDGKGD